jgi:hypothetical protein
VPTSESSRAHPDAQTGQDHPKTNRLEANLQGLGSDGRTNKRSNDSRHPQSDFKAMGEQQTAGTNKPWFEKALPRPLTLTDFLRKLGDRIHR